MKPTPRLSALALFLAAAGRVAAADPAAVLAPAARLARLEAARNILAPAEVALPAGLVDPFHPAAFAGVSASAGPAPAASDAAAAPSAPKGDQAVLQAIAAGLRPSGYFVVGGQPTLVFGQKKVKAGSFLTITFEGNSYTLEIAAIDRSTFTLRLNREEFTRPLK
ncbi:MAG: hypothetical protein HY302_16245 [Opitutae bacterium]|nr:hypothetical protein [Opitutae bacterium]